MERTLALIKPDAVLRNLQGAIIDIMQKEGFKVIALKMLQLSPQQASIFYDDHKEQYFYDNLINYMTSGAIVAIVLEAENAVNRYRKLMGTTNPDNAEEGTIRKKYALSQSANSVHGSDSIEAANKEIRYFFNTFEVV